MPDKDMIIRSCENWIKNHKGEELTLKFTAVEDLLSVLKEQEPKPVELYGKDDWYGLVCVCPDCKAEWMSCKEDTHFCPRCGQAVKWE